ncbi:HAD family hydrolase [Treponema parvum]|uniref:HAD family hydrolase n=1 Tax=Treponema parvum TaxID=138851 RepID=A0A975ICU3_9SPIR|nr:HAD family hydrolase [Treponema parvum]QTQ12361.1 HAD family hydrolase [Treponema parvum]
MKDFEVIAFDIDGTLYPSWRLNLKIFPYILSHLRFFLQYGKVRKILHRTAPLADFFEYQARLLAIEMKCTAAEAREKIDTIVYKGLRPFFDSLTPYKNVEETFRKLKEAGYRLAILSDFPPEQKGAVWGVIPYCETVLGTETIGALKPSKYPFGILSMVLKVPPEKILYVGNSIRFDVNGAKNAGMKTAYLEPWYRRLFHIKCPSADICFADYRKFQDIILEGTPGN